MKKIFAVALALVLCFSLSVAAFAQTDDTAGAEDCDVSLTVDDTGGALSVKLDAHTAVTDGVVTITYDSAKLSIAAEDVTATTAVDMDSVNASQAGTLKISWISAEAVDGTLFDLGFSVKEGANLSAGSFAIDGLVVDEDNNEASLGMITTLAAEQDDEQEPPTEGNPEDGSEGGSEEGSGSGSEDGSGAGSESGSEGNIEGETGDSESTSGTESAKTGDGAPVLLISVTALVVLVAMAALLLKRRTVKR